MKTRTMELTGFCLDYAVAQAMHGESILEFVFDVVEDQEYGHKIEQLFPMNGEIKRTGFNPSRVRGTGLFIVNTLFKLHRVIVNNTPNNIIIIHCFTDGNGNIIEKGFVTHGRTLVEAASRCFVFARLGEYIEIPEHYINAQINRDLQKEIKKENAKTIT